MLVAVSVLLAVKYGINTASDLRLEHSSLQLSVASDVHLIHKHIDEANRIIDLFLLSPDDKYRQQFFAEMEAANELISLTVKNSWVKERELAADLTSLNAEIDNYSDKIARLMDIRADRSAMYPAISLAEQSMLRINDHFVTSMNYAIDEIQGTEPFVFADYEKFVVLRDKWRRLIMAYRIYVINRTASLPKDRLPGLLANIRLFINNIIKDIEIDLLPMLEYTHVGLETAESISVTYENAKKWRETFLKVQNLADTDEWRSDIPYTLKEVAPASDKIYLRLEHIIRFLNLSTAEDLKAQRQTSDDISMFLWLLLASFSIIFVLVYFVIYSSLLQPIAVLANSLKDKDVNDASPFKPMFNSTEMKEFVYALNDMQQQINFRQNQLEHMAMHDALTKLPNRSLLLDRINSAIATYNRYEDDFALIILDMDRFKDVNDTLGHLVGDEILVEVSHRLRSLLRDSDTVARLGGDEFAIILQKLDLHAVKETAQKISDDLEKVYHIREHNLYLGASLGIALYPQHGKDPETLIQHADVAMYTAKNQNIDYEIYRPEDDTSNVRQLSLLSDLRNAISNNELFLEYQPVYTSDGTHVSSFECLLRWQHPKYGTVMPDQFIFHAEKTGLIKKITQWVLARATESISILHKYDRELYLSVNITAWDLQDESMLDYVDDCLSNFQLNYDSIVFELTESSMMNDSLRVRSVLHKLNSKGIRFSVDDFGTGFSSLIYLTQLPISFLKIDKSFVQSMNNNKNDAMVVRSIIDLAHNMNLKVVAEGVEDKETLLAIRDLNCDMVQGFIYGKPMTLDKVISLYPSLNGKPDIKLITS